MKADARVRYTKMRIREAFFQCLEEKPVNRVTVKELCELAEINRATFYAHYKDPFDLLERLEEETLTGLKSLRNRQGAPDQSTFLLSLLRGMQGERRRMGLLASRNGDPAFGARVSALFYEITLPSIEQRLPRLSAEERQEVYRFLAGGCGNLISDWMNRGMTEPPEKLAERLNQLCAAVMRAYDD